MQGPYFALVPVVGVVILACWLLSVVTRNYSWVDRVWSIAPPGYVVYVVSTAKLFEGGGRLACQET